MSAGAIDPPRGWAAENLVQSGPARRPLADLTILLVEDDPELATYLAAALGRAGAAVVTASSIRGARDRLLERYVDVRFVDRVLGDGDGYVSLVLDRRPVHDQPVGLVCMSKFGVEADMQLALDQRGAVVLTKPFSIDLAVRAILRACAKAAIRGATWVAIGDWTFDRTRCVLFGKERCIELPPPEASILGALVDLPDGEGLNAWSLADRAWGRNAGRAGDKRARHAVFRLRQLLEDHDHQLLKHDPDRGYRLAR